ncbi:MAG: peptide deformylase [Patescibacteria group bacterium]|nr:peptide deformylase [Patescibacteria group bacterium]
MKVNEVVQVGDKVLKQKALAVPHFGDKEKAVVKKMKDILIKASGIGLAAPQIGENKQIILVGTPDKKLQKELGMGFFVLINPKIIDRSDDEETMEEGCLSFMKPEIRGKVSRPLYVKVSARDEKGQLIELEAFDLMARSICHEVDHLRGVLFTDIADPASIYEAEKEKKKEQIIG